MRGSAGDSGIWVSSVMLPPAGRDPPHPAPPPSGRVVVGGVPLAAVAALAACLLLVSRLGSPGQVATVTVANTTPYNLEVAVGKPGSARQVGLGTVRREARGAFEGV